ncbi:MAG: hypothetical protein HC880_09590 [Bacteroidia bacterium]|nr:hypothetical protein [Bacteroidia bacterium]
MKVEGREYRKNLSLLEEIEVVSVSEAGLTPFKEKEVEDQHLLGVEHPLIQICGTAEELATKGQLSKALEQLKDYPLGEENEEDVAIPIRELLGQ